ncbi:unnamed protein product [Phyllotreta striolata]|uniref:Uncharacterized protein n=1 Tax=Phyllotreta striolata TaxID=444603 RepID=A0A9N9XS64_PHYSR|nr:unnamed protein product [Phyllotreta striolata]
MGLIPEKKCFKQPSKLIKFIILFLCAIFTSMQVGQCFQKFFHPSTSTYMSFILNESVKYPCLTICRRPPYKTDLYPKFGISHFRLDTAFTFRFFNFSEYSLSDFFHATTYNFTEVFAQVAYASVGYLPQGEGSSETVKVTSSFHFYRGRCFTFQPLTTSDIFSLDGGYAFLMYHNKTTEVNEAGVSAHGYQIYLHDPNEAVTYTEDERNNFLEILHVEADEDMRVKFEIQEFGRIPTKENRCVANPDYSKSKCENMCVNQQIAQRYNCTAPFLDLPEGVSFPECSSFYKVRYLIRDIVSKTVWKSVVQNCDCPMACNYTVYKTSIINRREVHETMAPNSLFYLYSTNLVFRMTEVLGYDLNQLLSDVGGSLGFLLGLSVISLICLCEEIFELAFKYIFKRKAKTETGDSNREIVGAEEQDESKFGNEIYRNVAVKY